jgi:hypothetical protein
MTAGGLRLTAYGLDGMRFTSLKVPLKADVRMESEPAALTE